MWDCPDTHERSSCDVPHQCDDCLEGMSSLSSRRPCRFGCSTGSAIDVLICRKDICIRILPSGVETRQQSSSEMIIPVFELLTVHFSKGHVSELNILNNRPYNVQCTPKPVCCRNAPSNSSEVIIPVLEHGKLHFGSGRVSVLSIMIQIAISPGASLGF